MPIRVQIVCVVNPDQFDWKSVIKIHYLSGLLKIEPINKNLGLVDLIVPTITDEDFHQDIERLRAFDFSKQEDQITFNYIIQEHLGVFTFLLQDGKLYELYEIVEMGDKGMEQITGGGKGVILVDHQFIEDLPLSPLDSLKIR